MTIDSTDRDYALNVILQHRLFNTGYSVNTPDPTTDPQKVTGMPHTASAAAAVTAAIAKVTCCNRSATRDVAADAARPSLHPHCPVGRSVVGQSA